MRGPEGLGRRPATVYTCAASEVRLRPTPGLCDGRRGFLHLDMGSLSLGTQGQEAWSRPEMDVL